MSRNFHERFVQSLITFRDKYLKASDGLLFQFVRDSSTGKYGYKDKNGNFVPFKTTHTLTKSITAGTSTSTTDMGENHEYRYVSVAPTPSQAKTVTASRSAQTVLPDSGKLLSKVTVNKFPDATGTYGVITTTGVHDMGTGNNFRYVNVNVNANAGRSWYHHDALYRTTVPRDVTVPNGATGAIGAYYMIIVTWINNDNHGAGNDKPVLSFSAHTDHKRIGGQIVIWENTMNAMSCTYIFKSNTANEWRFSLYPNGFDDRESHFGSLSYEIVYLG